MKAFISSPWTISLAGGAILVIFTYFMNLFLDVQFNRSAWDKLGIANTPAGANTMLEPDLVYKLETSRRYRLTNGDYLAIHWKPVTNISENAITEVYVLEIII